ncbi:MAG: hypothetical protein DA408_04000 [Bacteroidetes bacterium]|nr:MAG: hypothetical protein C7N36_07955 [Bacteroidota bacterium]PTM14062.1 MAG: hypothetical protein DA408_04000 [Bacteroidota bacterium]
MQRYPFEVCPLKICAINSAKIKSMQHLLLLFLSFATVLGTAQNNYYQSHKSNTAFLGISDAQISNEKAKVLGLPNAYGSYVRYVYEGTAAAMAGLQPFDYIYGFDEDMMSRGTGLTKLLSRHQPGDQVNLRVIRQGKEMTLPATLGQPNDSTGEHAGGTAFLGVREHDDNENDELGVRIETVRNSSARQLGLLDDDVITAVNGYKMVDWHDISAVLNNMDAGDPITIDFLRDGSPQQVTGAVGSHDESAMRSNSRGFLGIYSGHMDETKAKQLNFDNPYGSYIKRVIPGSAAEKAGLEPLDYVVGINDYDMTEHRSLTGALSKFSPGDQVTVTYIRNGKRLQTNAILGDESDENLSRPCAEEPFFGVSATHNDNGSRPGVSVNIVKNSAAQQAGLENGDVILAMDGKMLIDWGDLSAIINASAVGEEIAIDYRRKEEKRTTVVAMGSECDENGKDRNENQWYDYNYDYSFSDQPQQMPDEEPAVDMDRIKVDLKDMEQDDADAMARKGVAMPLINNLTIENIQLFPNPNRGMFRLEFELPQRGETSVRVFNSDARLIYSFDLGEYQGKFSDDIDISQNGPGAYFLEVRQGATSMVKKVILQY